MSVPPSTPGLFPDVANFPRTRYQGSKRKLAARIAHELTSLSIESALDAFSGTASVGYALKCAGVRVTCNDASAFNQQVALALVVNQSWLPNERACAELGQRRSGVAYDDFIERTFDDIYFTREENRWLDVAVGNVRAISNPFDRALAYFAIGQAALAKRPYNLFHRRNLYMRFADVSRSFGNKSSWDRPFDEHVRAFASEARAAVFEGPTCTALRGDAMACEPGCDLVYIDPPYINAAGTGVDYHQFYHFLDGLVEYGTWPERVDHDSRNRGPCPQDSPWTDPRRIRDAFAELFERFRDSILAVSYRSDGVPSMDELCSLLRRVKPSVRLIDLESYQYALSTRRATREMLLIGE